MTFSGINYIAVIVATLAGFGLGAVWYMVLGRAWMRAIGKTEAEIKQNQVGAKALPFVIALVALFVMALMLAGLMGHLGFVITTMGVNHAFAGAKPMLTLIDGGHWLAVLLVMGAAIGAFGI
jgi:hypothetical protein